MNDYSIDFDTLSELLSTINDISEQENIINIDIRQNSDGYGYSAIIQSRPYEGTEGQDRDNYVAEKCGENYD